MKEKIKTKKQTYRKPTLIDIGQMKIITKDNSASTLTDNSGTANMAMA